MQKCRQCVWDGTESKCGLLLESVTDRWSMWHHPLATLWSGVWVDCIGTPVSLHVYREWVQQILAVRGAKGARPLASLINCWKWGAELPRSPGSHLGFLPKLLSYCFHSSISPLGIYFYMKQNTVHILSFFCYGAPISLPAPIIKKSILFSLSRNTIIIIY